MVNKDEYEAVTLFGAQAPFTLRAMCWMLRRSSLTWTITRYCNATDSVCVSKFLHGNEICRRRRRNPSLDTLYKRMNAFTSLAPSVLHLSHSFQCSPTLNCQPYGGRLPLTSWWRKSLNMTVGQSSPISLTHHCYDWHPGFRCGWTCNQLTSKVDRGITGSRLRWSTLTFWATPQSGNQILISLRNSCLYWTAFARNRDTAVPGEGNGDLQTLICVLVARPRQCPTLSHPVPWQNWMAAYLGYTLRMKTLFRGWPIMVHDTHTRRRKRRMHLQSSWQFHC